MESGGHFRTAAGDHAGRRWRLYPDRTLFEIDLTDGGLSKLFQATFIPDSQAIGFCPDDGLHYHAAGSESYRDDPSRTGHAQGGPDIAGIGFQDGQYLEAIHLGTRSATAVFNANPCPNPDPLLPCLGLVAPRPDWVLPVIRRDSTQTDSSFRARGPDEFTAPRGLAWSADKGLFYLTDNEGIFQLERNGNCRFLARPAFPSDGRLNECKAVAFVTVGDETRLFVGHRNGFGSSGLLLQIDPETGDVLGETALTYPAGGGNPFESFGGLLGMEQHPVTGVLYGIRKTADNFARELVAIDPVTGTTTLIGNMGMHIAGITFVPKIQGARFEVTSVVLDGTDLTLDWTGGVPPFQVETSETMAEGSWTDAGGPTNSRSTTVTVDAPPAFFRVRGQDSGPL